MHSATMRKSGGFCFTSSLVFTNFLHNTKSGKAVFEFQSRLVVFLESLVLTDVTIFLHFQSELRYVKDQADRLCLNLEIKVSKSEQQIEISLTFV